MDSSFPLIGFLITALCICGFAGLVLVVAMGYTQRQFAIMRRMRRWYLDRIEKDREEISMELHDRVAAGSLQLEQAIVRHLEQSSDAQRELSDLLSELKMDIARSNERLFPYSLKKSTLEGAIGDLAVLLGMDYCHVTNESKVSHKVEGIELLHLYRVIQEIMVNAHKYAKPSFMDVTIWDPEAGALEVNITYAPTGEAAKRAGKFSRGRVIIQERLKRIQAKHWVERDGQSIHEHILLKP